jgi:hypothetical protein
MPITATQTSLERFIEVKRAAQQRMAMTGAPKTAGITKPKESFLNIIKSLKPKDDNIIEPPAPQIKRTAAVPASARASDAGLLSVYGMNRILSQNLSETSARNTLLRTRHLGNLFDAVA